MPRVVMPPATLCAGINLLLILAFAATLVTASLPSVQFHSEADEGYYLRYATRVAEQGPAAFPSLMRGYLDNPAARTMYPHPLRVTTVLLDALAVRIGGPSMASLQCVSLASFLLLLAAGYLIAARLAGVSTAVWTALLVSVSPLQLAMARHALADSLMAALMTVSLALCIQAVGDLRAAGRRWWNLALAYTAALLAKEMAVVLVPISLVLLSWHGRRAGQQVPVALLCAVSVIPVAAALGIALWAAGGPAILWEKLQTTPNIVNVLAALAGDEPWFQYVLDYLLLSPWTTLCYLAWLGYLAGAREPNERLLAWAIVPLLFVVLTAPITPKIVRYALVLDLPIRFGTVLLIQRLLSARLSGRGARVMTAVVMFALVAADLQAFHQIFLREGDPYDPVSPWLFYARGFLKL